MIMMIVPTRGASNVQHSVTGVITRMDVGDISKLTRASCTGKNSSHLFRFCKKTVAFIQPSFRRFIVVLLRKVSVSVLGLVLLKYPRHVKPGRSGTTRPTAISAHNKPAIRNISFGR